jgi:hypothetical protein
LKEPGLKIHWKAFSVSKQGNRAEENEDQYSPHEPRGTFSLMARFDCALADGATSASFSRLWARLLVDCAIGDDLAAGIAPAQTQWHQSINQLSLPWHAQEKAKQGAFATLLRLTLQPMPVGRSKGTWRAVAVGDSCLFLIRAGSLVMMAPELALSDFKKAPLLLSSLPARNAAVWQRSQEWVYSGSWNSSDQFFLMSDALSAWFLAESQMGRAPWRTMGERFLSKRKEQEAFSTWIDDLREARAIKNDDTTLLWIRMGERERGLAGSEE